MYRVPTAMVTSRDIVVGGTVIPADTTLDAEQIASLRTIQPLLANGTILVNPDPYARRAVGNPSPTYVNPGAYKEFVASLEA